MRRGEMNMVVYALIVILVLLFVAYMLFTYLISPAPALVNATNASAVLPGLVK